MTDDRNPAQKRLDAALAERDACLFVHWYKGESYGPSQPHETLADYKIRVRKAYGSLAGVTFTNRFTKEKVA